MKSCLVNFVFLIGFVAGQSGLHSEHSAPTARVQQCREGCLEKFGTEDFACLQGAECSMCWDQCASEPSKINTSILNTWNLRTVSMVRQGSLVSADVAWPPLDAPTQCLVTWEVSGGGLMGNLLTDQTTVELSLWPDTKYRVQVTCKNKITEAITRSLPLTLDTSQAFVMIRVADISAPSSPSSSSKNTIHQSGTISKSHDGKFIAITKYASSHLKLEPSLPSTSNFDLTNFLYKYRNELIVGLCAAIFVFVLFVVLYATLNLRRRRPTDKESLIDNEVKPELQPHNQTIHV